MEKDKFEYTYSAPTKSEREQIEDIRKDYVEKSEAENKLEQLKALDKKVKSTPRACAIIFGVVGILIFGLGMTMFLEWNIKIWGVVVGVLGCGVMAVSYFVFKKLRKAMLAKYKSKILKLSDELLKQGRLSD